MPTSYTRNSWQKLFDSLNDNMDTIPPTNITFVNAECVTVPPADKQLEFDFMRTLPVAGSFVIPAISGYTFPAITKPGSNEFLPLSETITYTFAQ